jgi:two-component system, NarL family, sensor kinase
LKSIRHSRKPEGKGRRLEGKPPTAGLHPARSGLPGRSQAKAGELAKLRARLAEAEEALRAIRIGAVDAVVVTGRQGRQVFTLEGAEHAYRVLIESMSEGALTLSADKTILYANQCFARMVKCPLEQVTGGSIRRFLSAEGRAMLRPLLKQADKSGSKIQVRLNAGDGSQIPVHISIRPLAKNGSKMVTFGMVVTDMTEARRTEELLRALTHRVVQAQESERGRVALELHDTITQKLCAVLLRIQTLADRLPERDGLAKAEAMKLLEIIGTTVEEVERISRNLRPSILEHIGLVAGLHDTSAEFANRTGVSVKLVCVELTPRLPADTELALYRILQETLKNVEKHARARHVTVHLTNPGDTVQLTINDDGMGFDPNHHSARRKGKGGFGLLGMRERASYVGGTLKVKSVRRAGTEIEIRIPLPPSATATK